MGKDQVVTEADWYRNASDGEIDAALQAEFVKGYQSAVRHIMGEYILLYEAACDMAEYVPGYFAEKWVHRESIENAKNFLLVIGDGHKSDCSTHNEPAYPNGECDCA